MRLAWLLISKNAEAFKLNPEVAQVEDGGMCFGPFWQDAIRRLQRAGLPSVKILDVAMGFHYFSMLFIRQTSLSLQPSGWEKPSTAPAA